MRAVTNVSKDEDQKVIEQRPIVCKESPVTVQLKPVFCETISLI